MGLKASGVAAYPMRQAAKAWSLFVRLLHERTILVLTIMFCGGVGTTMWHFSRLSSKLIESTALQGMSVQSESLEELRTIYTSEVVERVRSHGIEVTHDYRTKEGAIPLPVTFSMELGKRIGERGSGIQVRLYSEYPFPFRKGGGPRDDFEREALRQLRKDPDRPFFRFEDFEGRPSLRYATADRMRASCVACHNSHAESPKTDWKVGDVRGVLEIIRPLDIAAAQTRAGLKETLGLLATMALLGLSGLTLVIGRLRRTSAELEKRIAERSVADARLATMHEINLAATSTLDLRGVLNVLMEKIDVLLPYTAFLVWLVDRESGLLERAACWNLDEVEWKRRKLTGTPPLVKEAMTSKTPVVARNVQTDPRTLDPEFYREQGLVSYLGVPLQIKGQVLGVLVFLTREEHQFSDEEIEFLSTLVGQAAVAIHNSQLHEQSKMQAVELERANKDLERKEEIQKLLKEISQDITRLDINSLLGNLTVKVREFLQVDVADVRILEGGHWYLRGVSGADPSAAPAVRPGTAQRRTGWIVRNRRALVVSDITRSEGMRPEGTTERLGIRGFLGVPIFSREGEVIGILRALTYQPRDFTQEEVHLLQQLANGAAVALENAWLLERTKTQAAELQEANKVKNEFLGFVSHELRTPVNVIMGYAAILQSKMLGEINAEQDNALEKMSVNSKELLSMIEQLLEATKIEAGAAVAEFAEVNLSDFLDELRSAYIVPLKKKIRLDWNCPGNLPVIRTDGEKLRHILLNVIGNAVKYTEQGSVAVAARHVGVENQELGVGPNSQSPIPNPGFIEFSVTDTGIGIPEDELPRIFEMFSQVRGGRTKSAGGVGLGLHIVKKFTELLGGDIRVTSEEGKGSTFTIAIPTGSNGEAARDNKILRADESSDRRENERPGLEHPFPPADPERDRFH